MYHSPFSSIHGTGEKLLVLLFMTWPYASAKLSPLPGMPADGSLLLVQLPEAHMLPVTSTSASSPDITSPTTVTLPVKAGNCDASCSQADCELGARLGAGLRPVACQFGL